MPWAGQVDPGSSFLGRGTETTPRGTRAVSLTRLRNDGGGHVVAHSYGANAALLAAQTEPGLVRSLVLFEPACLDLARGGPAVEEHIAAMSPVFDVADDPSVSAREFSARFAAATGAAPPDLSDAELEAAVARLRGLRPPWGTGLSPGARLGGADAGRDRRVERAVRGGRPCSGRRSVPGTLS